MNYLPALQPPGSLPELDMIEALLASAPAAMRARAAARVNVDGRELPIHVMELGSKENDAPAVGFFGGVHGVERIGAQVVLAFLHSLVVRLEWDESLHDQLQRVRLVFMPLVNPGGMLMRSRSNPAGVDLMRNAPVEATGRTPPLLGGQRLSRRLPWYRGRQHDGLQPEASALCDVVRDRLLTQPFSITLDCHSGFGVRDRIWFPYARSLEPIDCLPELYALRSLFRTAHPYHSIYVIEPQAHRYTTHGDLWDHLYLQRQSIRPATHFLPLTLEMGSWLWIKKSPSQIFSQLGMFNPLAPHRHQRILRQHTTFLDFLVRAAVSWQNWLPTGSARRHTGQAAMEHWYHSE